MVATVYRSLSRSPPDGEGAVVSQGAEDEAGGHDPKSIPVIRCRSSPDGAQLVYAANQQLFLRTISELEARPIAGTEGGLGFLVGTTTPVFSPDGQFIAYYDGAFKKIGTGGGTAVTLSQGDPPWGMSWSEDWIVFGQAANGVMRVSANGGTLEQLVTVGSDEVAAHPQMLPGNEVVLFTLASAQATGQDRWDTARIVAQTLDSDERKTIVEGGSHARYLATGHLVYALGGTLFAVPFDDRRLEVTGGAVPVVEGVRRSSNFGLGTGAAFYGLSSTGSLVFVPGGNPALLERRFLMVPREGDAESLSLPPDAYRSLRISPDDQRIAFHTEDGQEANIWVYDLAGDRAAQRLTFEGWNRFPIWSGDGQRVVFQSDREGDRALYWQPADGAGPAERLTEPGQGAAHVPESWSPVEDRFSYSEMAQGVVSLWTFSMSDAQATRFGDAQSIAPFNSEFSPDGNWLAYTLRSGTGANVYVEPFPATGAKYQITTENGHHPVWLPDGPGLSYRIGSNVQVAVSVNTTPSFSFGNPVSAVTAGLPTVESFASRSYDVTRDGSAFLAVAPDADVSEAQTPGQVGAPQEIWIVLNWFEELKRLVPLNWMALEVGTTLGPYRVTAKIGEGGMGEVYQARDTKLDRDVALKVLPEAFRSDPDRLARFEREAKVLASLNHPNIGSIYGLEEAEGIKALVLELVEGPTLADRIKQGPIPLDEALPIAKQIAEALEAAHEQGVIHRDLKPANIKVKDDGTVKVLDFGLAKAFQPDANDPNMSMSPTISLTAAATQMGMVIGTAAYMSPEQASGKAVDKRADVWAFGVVLYEMLTGTRPFVGDDVSKTLAHVIAIDPDWSACRRKCHPCSVPSSAVACRRTRSSGSTTSLICGS